MNNQNKFLVQILEKIGTPLFTSVNEVASRAIMSGQVDQVPSNAEQAETIAKLLTNVTKASAQVSDKLDLESKDPESDDLQISLAAILSPVVANLYQLTGQPPKDDDLDRVTSHFETLTTFSNNFSSIKEGEERLEKLGAGSDAHDTNQKLLQNIMAMVPLVNAVAAFPFGQAPEKLLKTIVVRLEKDSEELCQQMGLSDSAALTKTLNAIVMIYSQCHFSEMARIMSLSEQDRQASTVTVDNVWAIYDQRVDMLKTLVKAVGGDFGDDSSKSESSGTVAPDASPQEVPVAPAPVSEPESVPTNDTAPAENAATGNPPPAGNPMSFFKKKEGEGEA